MKIMHIRLKHILNIHICLPDDFENFMKIVHFHWEEKHELQFGMVNKGHPEHCSFAKESLANFVVFFKLADDAESGGVI